MIKRPHKRHSDSLKLIAIGTMLIDHIGILFFPGELIFRIIGRLALPIFAYQLSIGYQYTSDKNRYLSRLWVFALLSQIPYSLAFQTLDLNILFVLFLSLFMIHQYSNKRYYAVPFIIGLVVLFEWMSSVPSFSYGLYALLLPFFFYLFRAYKPYALFTLSLVTVLEIFGASHPIQLFAIVGFLLCLYVPVDKWRIKLNKYVFYWFYPIHLLALWGIERLFFQ